MKRTILNTEQTLLEQRSEASQKLRKLGTYQGPTQDE